MKRICLLAIALVSGCGFVKHTTHVKVISDPPGAVVEINGGYKGKTPYEFDYSWRDVVGGHDPITVTVLPFQPGQYSQRKAFIGAGVPEIIYFNMNLQPVFPPARSMGAEELEDIESDLDDIRDEQREQRNREQMRNLGVPVY